MKALIVITGRDFGGDSVIAYNIIEGVLKLKEFNVKSH